MKVKPKEVLLNLPVALLFDESWEIQSFAANINTVLHGKVRLKTEELGMLGGRQVGLFYLQRDLESQQIHDEFIRLIEEEEVAGLALPPLETEKEIILPTDSAKSHTLCQDCDDLRMLHVRGEDHCRCGDEWANGMCLSMRYR